LPVVVARRLCDRAEAGQILCTQVVADLLASRHEFSFRPLGKLELKGVPDPVTAFAVGDEAEPPAAEGVPQRTPFVGGEGELLRLEERVAEAATGHGGLVLVAGEPGIGKTRIVEEIAERRRRGGWEVLWGRCYEGGWAPPYTPFAEALDAGIVALDP